MNEPHDPNVTADVPPSSVPPDSLDAGLAAGFGRRADSPRSAFASTLLRPVLLKDAEGESAHIVKPKSDAMPPKAEIGDRYRLDGEIARGGMGAVLRGRDVDLGRDLAVKVLLEKHANRPEVARRFIEEAQIGGQLQHPGVVPVYDIGRFGDRPFFTMKLVKGQTLAAILDEREDASADRPRLLGIALKIAETLAYAHAKGVIHRDLKPANIMVGAFGEVQVMDWGLAKVLAEGGIADEERASRAHREPEEGTQIRTARSGGSSGSFGTDTEAGSLLGTPAYMPPEQANGDIAHLDRRADVFGLGAILCEMLTGKPPYLGRSGEEVRRKAANGDLADATARLDACGADAELIALTKKCLSPEAIDRPKDAQEVTEGLSAYLNGVQERLQTVERERAVAVVREAEQRKKRKAQLALAAAVVGLMLGGGAFAFWRAEQAQAGREREARTAEAVAALLNQAEDALKADDSARAAVFLEAAKKRSAEGGAEKDAERLQRLGEDLALLRDLDAVDQFRWTYVDSRFPEPTKVALRTREALRRFGADPQTVSVDEAATLISSSAVRERIVSSLYQLFRYQGRAEVLPLLRRVDADPYRDAIREALLTKNSAKLAELVSQNSAPEQPPGFVAFLSELGDISLVTRRQLLQSAITHRPGNLNLLMTLANTYQLNLKEMADEKLRWDQAAVAAGPSNYAAYNNLGVTLAAKGQWVAAIACFKKAITIDPTIANAHSSLGAALAERGQVDAAIACHKKAMELNPSDAMIHNNLGIALETKGLPDEAITSYRKAIELDAKNANAHSNLGAALARAGQVNEAIACHKKAIELDPKASIAHFQMGNTLRNQGELDGAIACYEKAIELDPKDAEAHCNLGLALSSQGRFTEALVALKRGHELGMKQPGWRYPSMQWVRQAEAQSELAAKLPAYLKGDFQPIDVQDRLGLAGICIVRKLYPTAMDLYSAAFAADPKLADDLKAGHRYNAACYAALASAGRGENANKLNDQERTRLRNLALDWLRADLPLWTKQLESGNAENRAAAQRSLLHWQKDTDLAGIRDKEALAKFPAAEQKAFTQLWADVAALLKKVEGMPNPAQPPAAKPAEKKPELGPPPGGRK